MLERKFRQNSVIPLAPLDRVKDLSDGIFAFSMTLLVLSIDVPVIPKELASSELLRQIGWQWREVLTYVISFLNIGSYWMLHHGIFANLIHANRTLIQLNLLFLLTVTFLPYPTALQGEYGRMTAVALVYGVTIAVNYAMLILVARYAYSQPELIDPDFHLPIKKLLRVRLMLPLGFAMAGAVLAFYFTRLSFLFFALVPLSNAIPICWLVSDQEINAS